MAGRETNLDPPASSTKLVRVKRSSERRSVSRSAIRALDVLEHFGRIRRPLRAREIGLALGLPPSTTDQLLKTMVGSGHLTFEAVTKTYLPSHRLGDFAGWIVSSYGGQGRLRRLVQDVQAKSEAVVTLTSPNDLDMQVLEEAGVNLQGARPERGLRISMFGSAVGAAYLSTLEEAEIRRLADRARLSSGEADAATAKAGQIRLAGFSEGEGPDGSFWSLAMPLRGGDFPVPLVLGLAGPRERVLQQRERLLEMMRAAVTACTCET